MGVETFCYVAPPAGLPALITPTAVTSAHPAGCDPRAPRATALR